MVLAPGHMWGSGLGLSPKGLKPIVKTLIFYEIFKFFRWIWGFQKILKMSFKPCKRIFMKGKGE